MLCCALPALGTSVSCHIKILSFCVMPCHVWEYRVAEKGEEDRKRGKESDEENGRRRREKNKRSRRDGWHLSKMMTEPKVFHTHLILWFFLSLCFHGFFPPGEIIRVNIVCSSVTGAAGHLRMWTVLSCSLQWNETL